MNISGVKEVTKRLSMILFNKRFSIRVEKDNKAGDRVFLQIYYYDECRITGEVEQWRGRKWYLSEHMTVDEIIKTAYAAFKATVEHEIMEAFTVDGKVLFNPHVSYEALLSITDNEVRRT